MSGERKTTAVRPFSLGYKLRMKKVLSIEHKTTTACSTPTDEINAEISIMKRKKV